ncbi:hypothetical protein ONS95_004730 [Cadophora gregata]|uniref:uncharacterized protein n=1 Tax=Cadophora gregata TaxID=51156 RepID=UPI0026DAEF0A|nr:uncharacterized protein ONS95_004730 [Cadophora gregata]KAK0104440.1 hypothetical protein ONS95_004730 [Cadophora gregata]KAK0115466.1 hypothetical protein ONS96_013922 [Cadophora gregata f. sp. sojae]
MASESRRPLYKGPLLAPKRESWSQSYTVNPISKDHVVIWSGKSNRVPVIEFSSGTVPMPFLDPAIIMQRVREQKEWKAKQDRENIVEGSSQGG